MLFLLHVNFGMQKVRCVSIWHFPSVLLSFDGQTEFSPAFNFAILSYVQNLQIT